MRKWQFLLLHPTDCPKEKLTGPHSSHLPSQDSVADPSCKVIPGFSITVDCAVLQRTKNSQITHYSLMVEMQLIPQLAWIFLHHTSQTALKICPCKHWINYIET